MARPSFFARLSPVTVRCMSGAFALCAGAFLDPVITELNTVRPRWGSVIAFMVPALLAFAAAAALPVLVSRLSSPSRVRTSSN